MYQNAAGARFTLYVAKENVIYRETAFRFTREGAINVCYWTVGPFGYAISGGAEKATLARSPQRSDQMQNR